MERNSTKWVAETLGPRQRKVHQQSDREVTERQGQTWDDPPVSRPFPSRVDGPDPSEPPRDPGRRTVNGMRHDGDVHRLYDGGVFFGTLRYRFPDHDPREK